MQTSGNDENNTEITVRPGEPVIDRFRHAVILTDIIPAIVKKVIVDEVIPKYADDMLAERLVDVEETEALSVFEEEQVLYNMTVDEDNLIYYSWLRASKFHCVMMVKFIREVTGEKDPNEESGDDE